MSFIARTPESGGVDSAGLVSAGGGLGIFLPEAPQLIAGGAWFHSSQAANQVEYVLSRELAIVLPLQAGRL